MVLSLNPLSRFHYYAALAPPNCSLFRGSKTSGSDNVVWLEKDWWLPTEMPPPLRAGKLTLLEQPRMECNDCKATWLCIREEICFLGRCAASAASQPASQPAPVFVIFFLCYTALQIPIPTHIINAYSLTFSSLHFHLYQSLLTVRKQF